MSAHAPTTSKRDERGERQVHAVLEGEVPDRHDARARGEHEHERDDEEREPRLIAPCDQERRDAAHEREHREDDGDETLGRRPPVVEHEPVRPDDEREIAQHHAGLAPDELAERDVADREPGGRRRFVLLTGEEGGEDRPRGEEPDVEPAPLTPGSRPRPGEKHAVVEQHDDRGGHHHRLAEHAERARGDRRSVPRRRAARAAPRMTA